MRKNKYTVYELQDIKKLNLKLSKEQEEKIYKQ